MIRFVEELGLNAWPSLQTIHYDGWLLRFADGYTRRANSVNPLYGSSIDTAEKIRHCEDVYRSREQPVVFKLTTAARPTELDSILAEQGYVEEAPTSVQMLDLSSIPDPETTAVNIDTALTERWLSAFCRLNNVDSRHLPTMTRMLNNIIPARCFVALRQHSQLDAEIAAVGLAVLERGYMGLYDIVTAARVRTQGFGTQLVLHLLQWGRVNGALHAHLGVMCNNVPALHLYGKLGFQEIYRYWYRVKPAQTS
jgi:N-acetylglutamate synthase